MVVLSLASNNVEEEVLETVNWLTREGHNKAYRALRDETRLQHKSAERDDPEWSARIALVEEVEKRILQTDAQPDGLWTPSHGDVRSFKNPTPRHDRCVQHLSRTKDVDNVCLMR